MSQLRGARGALAGNYAALAVALLSQLILLPLLLTRLGATGAGFFVVLWSAVNFAGTGIGWLSGGGTVMLTQAAAAGNEAQLSDLYRRFGRGMARYGLVGWIVLEAWSLGVGSLWLREVPPGGTTQIRLAVHGAGAYMFALDVHQADLALLTARLRLSSVAFFRVAMQVLMFAFGTCGVLWGGGVAGMFVGYAAAAVLVSLGAHLLVRRDAWPSVGVATSRTLRPEPGSLGTFAGYSIVFSILQYVDTLVLTIFGGPAAVVLLTFLQRLPDAAILLIGRASETLGPYYTTMSGASDREPFQRTYLTASRVIWRVAAVSGAGYAVFGRDVVQWWSRGRLDLPPQWFFVASGFALVAAIVNRNAGLLAYYSGSPRAATRLLVWELAMRVTFVLLLVHRLGPTAPVLAVLAAQLAVLLVAYRRLECELLHVRLPVLLASCVWPALASAIPAAILMLCLRSLTTSAISQRGLALAAAAVGAAAVLTFQERALGLQFLRRRRA